MGLIAFLRLVKKKSRPIKVAAPAPGAQSARHQMDLDVDFCMAFAWCAWFYLLLIAVCTAGFVPFKVPGSPVVEKTVFPSPLSGYQP